ncbi:MAG: DTW domain-containing protein [Myxococcales bacterium]|nr:DTW domain-containing protein [Myxococcales bacterium]
MANEPDSRSNEPAAWQPREQCERCKRPKVVCYCAHVREVETHTRVVIVQHPREADVPINTARIARLCLPNSELVVTVEADEEETIRALVARAGEGGVGLLFPGDETKDIRELGDDPRGQRTLVVVDGTWWQAAKVLKKSPGLASLPRYGLIPTSPSNYRIRKEPSIECLSTIEALVEALSAIEGPSVDPRALLAPFEAMVDYQLEYARSGAGYGRHKKSKKPDRRREVPDELARTPTGVIVAYAESNAWPFDRADRPEPELVHWVAERLDDGARGEWIIAPRKELAPATPTFTELDEATLRAGTSVAQFAREWTAFCASSTTLATWNPIAAALLERALADASCASVPPRWLDLRPAAARYFKTRIGTLAECSPRFGPVALDRWAKGRAGARILHVAHIARALRAEALRPLEEPDQS